MAVQVLHRVIPIFIPQRACPFRCSYCNQFAIAGQGSVPTPEEAKRIVDTHLATMPMEAQVRIAFFGGSFTGMPLEEQEAYLKVTEPYVRSGRVAGVQLSTRPDYITREVLQLLQRYQVTLIELGAQSLDDEVLRNARRGHTVAQVREASRMITEAGFSLGLQMMIGLPGDTKEKAMRTAETIVALGASCTRIYPTLVVKDTLLAAQYRQGNYQPLDLETAVEWCKELYRYFTEHGVTILRMGLHPSEGLLQGTDYLAGPFHVSFKELVLTALWRDRIAEAVLAAHDGPVVVKVSAQEINYAVGYGSSNKKAFPQVRFEVEG
ncbi:MAG: radical SAM protein [Bacteroidales bacterium]|nr:radical SAM protein [Bacteroidales bacterium]